VSGGDARPPRGGAPPRGDGGSDGGGCDYDGAGAIAAFLKLD